MTSTPDIPIKITSKALEEALHIFENKNIPQDYALRIGLKSGGCGAAGFFIGFDKPKEQDQVFTQGSLQVLVDKRHFMYLLGMELDYEQRPEEQGFVFNKLGEKV